MAPPGSRMRIPVAWSPSMAMVWQRAAGSGDDVIKPMQRAALLVPMPSSGPGLA